MDMCMTTCGQQSVASVLFANIFLPVYALPKITSEILCETGGAQEQEAPHIMLSYHLAICCVPFVKLKVRLLKPCMHASQLIRPASPHSVSSLLLSSMSWFSKTQQGARPAKLPRWDEGNSPAGDVDRMLELVAKLCLKNSLEIREMQAAVLRTYVLPRDCGLAVAATDAAKNHVEQIKAVKGDQRAVDALGPVHVHVWAALVSAAAQCSINQEDANTLKARFDEATSSSSDPNARYTWLVTLIFRMC